MYSNTFHPGTTVSPVARTRSNRMGARHQASRTRRRHDHNA